MWLSGVLHVHLHVGVCLHLQAILLWLCNLLCGGLPWETDVFDATHWEESLKATPLKTCQLHAKPGPPSSSSRAFFSVETRSVENKESFHLIRLFPLENLINYRRKLLYWNICSRWQRIPLWLFLLAIVIVSHLIWMQFFLFIDVSGPHRAYLQNVNSVIHLGTCQFSDCSFVWSDALHF